MSLIKTSRHRLADLVRPHKVIVPDPILPESKPLVTTLAEAIAECKFHEVSRDIILEHFSFEGPVADVSEMLTITQTEIGPTNKTSTAIKREIDRMGCRPATIIEQLAYAKTKWDGNATIIALGSSWVSRDGRHNLPCLYSDAEGRKLGLNWEIPAVHWHEYSFLVVRK